MIKLIVFLLILLPSILTLEETELSLFNSPNVPRVLTEHSIKTFEVDSLHSCCRLQFVEADYESVLQNALNVILINTTNGAFYPSKSLTSQPVFISHETLIESPVKQLETAIFLTNPNNCSVDWSFNSTDEIFGNVYVPTFNKYILTFVNATTRAGPIIPIDSSRMYINRLSYEDPNRFNKVETIAEFYSLKGTWNVRSKTVYTRKLHNRSILYIRCDHLDRK